MTNSQNSTVRIITRTVGVLSLVSLFTDIASEMLYPILPLYLRSIGFSVALIGVLEGMAEAVAGLSKGYFGKLSDLSGRRLPFVRLGYLLSAFSKPMMAVWTAIPWVFSARTLDRLGKGIRTGARDALLSSASLPQHRGRVFGFHRAMDTLGAVIGPLLALLLLQIYPGSYRLLFFVAFVPGIFSVALTFMLSEKGGENRQKTTAPNFFLFLNYLKTGPPEYRRLLAGLLLFTLFNSSDFFLLLMLKHNGLGDTQVVGFYIVYNLIYAIFAYPMGSLGDRIGLRNTFAIGLLLFAGVYAGMGLNHDLNVFYGLFFLYGIYAAGTESIAKAWISRISAPQDTATAIGTYAAFNSLFSMLASSLAGLIWMLYGAQWVFLLSAAAALIVTVYLILFVPQPSGKK